MASAQVLSNSRKQEHLEAGKRRLEEFRKKKAAENAKKAASANLVPASIVSVNEKRLSDAEAVCGAATDGVSTSSGGSTTVNRPSIVESTNDGNSSFFSPSSKLGSVSDANVRSGSSANVIDTFGNHAAQRNGMESTYKMYEGLESEERADFSHNKEVNDLNNSLGLHGASLGLLPDQSSAWSKQCSLGNDVKWYDSSFLQKEESLPRKSSGSLRNIMSTTTNSSLDQSTNILFLNSDSFMPPENAGIANDSPSYVREEYIPYSTSTTGYVAENASGMLSKPHFDDALDFQERKLSNDFSGLSSMNDTASQIRDHSSTAFYSTFTSSPNHLPPHSSIAETQPRRSRPSFLDSLNVPRASPVLPIKSTPLEESVNSSNVNGLDILDSSANSRNSSDGNVAPFSKPKTSDLSHLPSVTPSMSVYTNDIQRARSNFNEPNMENNLDFLLPKPNEDFSALEQHIEDLTQEKFSLQRSLEASRVLAESLAAENTSLTDSYNQQRNAVNQLREDMEKLQEEINAQLVVLEAMKNEYANAQLECNAADERAKLLASEVIGLEEKALRLRSNELKLEKQLENSCEEISTYKKKVSSLEKERQDLQSTVRALQEEKKLLQSKVWKASSSRSAIDMNQIGIKRKEMSTSTEDLDTDSAQAVDARLLYGSEASSSFLPGGAGLNLEAASVLIPTDHTRIIVNINTLISELAFEKNEILKGLESAKADNIKLKGLNVELSQKLETQTQGLELLSSQSMVPENIPSRLHDVPTSLENTPYADEGDEAVETVLGWILKLFPGGPSRRRPRKGAPLA